MTASPLTLPTPPTLPNLRSSVLIAEPDENVPGAWAGSPSVVASDGAVFLAYRLRRPIGHGRGYRNVIARSSDGVRFETVATIERENFDADSLERPCLVRTPTTWRLYVSCATPGTKHWRVELLEAETVEDLENATARVVLPGTTGTAVKDPVILVEGGSWHLWASVHPLESSEHADRMTTDYATSTDGIEWTWHGTVLAGRAGQWDARGTRVTAVVVDGDSLFATYDGRATREQNAEEVTGLAVGTRGEDGRFGVLSSVSDEPLVAPEGSLRYLSILPGHDGSARWYYEVSKVSGAHELRTELVAG